MAELFYIYGTMGSGKTTKALIEYYDLKDQKHPTLLMKPSIDTRDGTEIIKSRINGIEADALLINPSDDIIKKFSYNLLYTTYIIVDEAQFLTPLQIEQFKDIVDTLNINVKLYGLRGNFKTTLFPGSMRAFELADVIIALESKCKCGRNKIVNARYMFDEVSKKYIIVYEGDEVQIGGDESYTGLCYQCWKEGNIDKGSSKVKK